MILVYQVSQNCLKLLDYKSNLQVECAILPLVNTNVFISKHKKINNNKVNGLMVKGQDYGLWKKN